MTTNTNRARRVEIKEEATLESQKELYETHVANTVKALHKLCDTFGFPCWTLVHVFDAGDSTLVASVKTGMEDTSATILRLLMLLEADDALADIAAQAIGQEINRRCELLGSNSITIGDMVVGIAEIPSDDGNLDSEEDENGDDA